MELFVKVKVENLFKAKDFTDKKSGETKKGKWKIQTFDNIETEQGMQMKLIDISIPDEMYQKVKERKGQEITLAVGTYINNNRVGFFGV